MKSKKATTKRPATRQKKQVATASNTTEQKPIQLTIASYGRRKSSPVETEEEESPSQAGALSPMMRPINTTSEAARRRPPSPVILSLPISDMIEDRHLRQHTLDDELTEYHADVLAAPAPQSIIATTKMAADTFEPTEVTTLNRCNTCRNKPGPCQSCIDQFNEQHAKSLQDFAEEREQDDLQFGHPNPMSFFNERITDRPPEVPQPIPVYNPREASSEYPQSQTEPDGIVSVGISPENQKESEGQQQLLQQNEEIERLQKEVSFLKEQLQALRLQQSHHHHHHSKRDKLNGKICKWHLGKINGQPLGLPIYYDDVTKSYESIAPFCSFQCMYAYRLEHKSAECAPLWLLFRAYKEVWKQELESESSSSAQIIPKLVPAPPREALMQFGGTMTEEEFLTHTKSWVTLSRSPFLPCTEYVNVSSVADSAVRLSSTAPENGTDSVLVRKRNKPHPNAENQWENSIRRSRLRR